MESTCRVVRGRVRLARGDLAGALADADAAAALVAEAEDLVGLHETLGLRVCVLLADGQVPAAEAAAAELLALIRDQEDAGMTADWSADITDALTRLGRGPELAGLLAAAQLTAAGRPAEAAPHLAGALAFYRSVGARTLTLEAEALLAAPA
jgi:chromosome segregation protein